MRVILKAKFSVPELRNLLKATGTSLLVEGNRWHDNRWGACTCEKCKHRRSMSTGLERFSWK